MSEHFEIYGIVEIMGHQIIAGKISEQVIAGAAMLRVDVPAVNGQEAYTKFYGGGSIAPAKLWSAITPTDEATAQAAAEGLRRKPIEIYKLNLPQLQAPLRYDSETEY